MSKRPTKHLRVSVGNVRRIEAGLTKAIGVVAEQAERTGSMSMVHLNTHLAGLLRRVRVILDRIPIADKEPR